MAGHKNDHLARLEQFASDLQGLGGQLAIEPKFRAHKDIFFELRQCGETWRSIAAALTRLGVKHSGGTRGLAATLKTYWNRNASLTGDSNEPPVTKSEAGSRQEAGRKTLTQPSNTNAARSRPGQFNAASVPMSPPKAKIAQLSGKPTSRFTEIRRLRNATKTSFEE